VSTAQIIASKDELIKQQTVQIKVQEQRIEKLQYQYQELLRALYGSKSERFVPTTTDEAQLHLFADPAAVEVQLEKEKISYERNLKNSNHSGSHKLPDYIPVIEQVIDPEENTEGLDKIGEEITESLDYTPASLIKLRIIRPKYVDKQADKVYIAAMPDRFMNKGIAEPGLLSHIVVNKYVNYLPLYRQAKQFDTEFNWQVSESTLNNWMSYVRDRLEPIYMCMQRQILKSGYIQVDESRIKVLERKQGKQSKGKSPPDHKKKMIGYQWVYLSPQDKMVYFNYRQGRLVDKGLALEWSPEQICSFGYCETIEMVSHERIYQYMIEDKKKGGELYKQLRCKKKYRKRLGSRDKRGKIKNRVNIKERPKIVGNRERVGDFEVDLVIGANHKGAMLTINELTTGYTKLRKIDSKSAKQVAKIIVKVLKPIKEICKTIASDNGKEFAEHEYVAK